MTHAERGPRHRLWREWRRTIPCAWGLLVVLAISVACRPDASTDDPQQRGYRGIVLDPPLPRPDFVLTDTEGTPFDFRGETERKLTLLFIGYTHCPDICPVHMANIAAVLRQQPQLEGRVRVIFITADPARDTPERLGEWLDNFSPRFVGLRGTPEEVHQVEQSLNLPLSVVPDSAEGAYTVGHAAQVVAFTPDGLGRVIFPFGTRQADYAHDLPRLLADRWGER